MDLNSEMSGLPVIQPAMITFLSLPTLQEQPIRNKCKNIQVSLFDNNQKITLTSRKWERKALKKENAYESEKFNSMKLQRTLQRAMFKSLPWLLEFYYANCNLFSSLFFFFGGWHLLFDNTFGRGFPIHFWKTATLSSVLHGGHRLSLSHRSHVLILMFQGRRADTRTWDWGRRRTIATVWGLALKASLSHSENSIFWKRIVLFGIFTLTHFQWPSCIRAKSCWDRE